VINCEFRHIDTVNVDTNYKEALTNQRLHRFVVLNFYVRDQF
jgi:hypothetical protein